MIQVSSLWMIISIRVIFLTASNSLLNVISFTPILHDCPSFRVNLSVFSPPSTFAILNDLSSCKLDIFLKSGTVQDYFTNPAALFPIVYLLIIEFWMIHCFSYSVNLYSIGFQRIICKISALDFLKIDKASSSIRLICSIFYCSLVDSDSNFDLASQRIISSYSFVYFLYPFN